MNLCVLGVFYVSAFDFFMASLLSWHFSMASLRVSVVQASRDRAGRTFALMSRKQTLADAD